MRTIGIISVLVAIFAIILVGVANIISAEEMAVNTPPEKALNIIVGFRTGIPTDIEDRVKATGAMVVSKNTDINFVVVDPKEKIPYNLMAEMKKWHEVAYVEYDHTATALFNPNDPGYSNQWGPPDILAPQAWDTTLGSSSVIVAIIDTGVDYNHPDIAANYLTGGYDWINNDNDPLDDNGHGTHVSGIAAAVTNNNVGVAGMSQSKIMVEKVLNNQGSGSYSAVANGIIDAANKGANVTSMSLG